MTMKIAFVLMALSKYIYRKNSPNIDDHFETAIWQKR
tara:strand:+ start:414 stop:524 length:111 start_codon:yes stop_codon:yes gene_type:complete